jgi:hypothetical protein
LVLWEEWEGQLIGGKLKEQSEISHQVSFGQSSGRNHDRRQAFFWLADEGDLARIEADFHRLLVIVVIQVIVVGSQTNATVMVVAKPASPGQVPVDPPQIKERFFHSGR